MCDVSSGLVNFILEFAGDLVFDFSIRVSVGVFEDIAVVAACI